MQDSYDDEFDDEDSSDDELLHYGTKRHSGRYPWGSGDDPGQHGSSDFLLRVKQMRKEGFTYKDKETGKTYSGDTAIAKSMDGMSTTQFRAYCALANSERRAYEVATAKRLEKEGKSRSEIARIMGKPGESSIRSLLNENSEKNMNAAITVANTIKEAVKKKEIVDVGVGVERELGVSKEKMNQALEIIQSEGYGVYGFGVKQLTNNNQQTIFRVACKPEMTHKEAIDRKTEIQPLSDDYYSPDGGITMRKLKPPTSISMDRVAVRYAEDGGKEMDGVIQIRRGVEDLSLGNSHYAQVRILVNGDHYLKGMAIYTDEKMPKGTDIIFNTNKTKDVPKDKVLKSVDPKATPENPFKVLLKPNGQSTYLDKDGKEQLSAINKVHEEGDWGEYAKKLPAQFLAKQKKKLITSQLNLAYADKQEEYDSIQSLTNPTIKKHFLKSFADDCDKSAVDLKAAALPRQRYQVILPIPSLKDNEIYAPNYNDGEKVALVRFPHGGTFEIPILKVNNKQKDAKSVLENAIDAVGINSKVAERLSGADFDGDVALVIPTGGKVNITSTEKLKGLIGFDPKDTYGTTEKVNAKGDKEYYNKYGQKIRVMKNTQNEMGRVSNLITDMTIIGASNDDLAAAVRHSMVVIDAEKHKLDYKQSEVDNKISYLKKKYQGHMEEDGKYHTGASTLISRAKSIAYVPERRGSVSIDKDTGEYVYKESGRSYVNGKGKLVIATTETTKMAATKDAHTLSSGHPVEEYYADYANKMKAMGNSARKEYLATGNLHYSKTAKTTYAKEVKDLDDKLDIALRNAPRERMAQVLATGSVKAMQDDNPDMTKKEYKKLKQQELEYARAKVGSSSALRKIEITDREWEAIQAGAVSENKLSQILDNTDADALKKRATPRETKGLSDAKIAKIKAMRASGYVTADIAKAVNASSSTVIQYLK